MPDAEVARDVAFTEFYEREHDRQVRRAFTLLRSNEAANDIVHDAMIDVYTRWAEIREPGAYVNRGVLNRCRDAARRARHAPAGPHQAVHFGVGDGDPGSTRRRDRSAPVQPSSGARAALLRRPLDRGDRRRSRLPAGLGRPVDRSGPHSHATRPDIGGVVMTDPEQQLIETLERRAATACPTPDLAGVLAGQRRTAGVGRPDGGRTRWASGLTLVAASAPVLAALGGLVVIAVRERTEVKVLRSLLSPSTPLRRRPLLRILTSLAFGMQ